MYILAGQKQRTLSQRVHKKNLFFNEVQKLKSSNNLVSEILNTKKELKIELIVKKSMVIDREMNKHQVNRHFM